MQLRCYRCGWSFAIKQDEIASAQEALEASGGSHHDVRCPRCRHTNRISVEQLRRATPRREDAEAPEAAPAAVPPEEEPSESDSDDDGEAGETEGES